MGSLGARKLEGITLAEGLVCGMGQFLVMSDIPSGDDDQAINETTPAINETHANRAKPHGTASVEG